MILVDTSACVAYLRSDGSPAHARLREGIAAGEELAVTEPVVLELLAVDSSVGSTSWPFGVWTTTRRRPASTPGVDGEA